MGRPLKQAAVYLRELQDGFQAKSVIDGWIAFYNSERPHTELDKHTPDDAYFGTRQTKQPGIQGEIALMRKLFEAAA